MDVINQYLEVVAVLGRTLDLDLTVVDCLLQLVESGGELSKSISSGFGGLGREAAVDGGASLVHGDALLRLSGDGGANVERLIQSSISYRNISDLFSPWSHSWS